MSAFRLPSGDELTSGEQARNDASVPDESKGGIRVVPPKNKEPPEGGPFKPAGLCNTQDYEWLSSASSARVAARDGTPGDTRAQIPGSASTALPRVLNAIRPDKHERPPSDDTSLLVHATSLDRILRRHSRCP